MLSNSKQMLVSEMVLVLNITIEEVDEMILEAINISEANSIEEEEEALRLEEEEEEALRLEDEEDEENEDVEED